MRADELEVSLAARGSPLGFHRKRCPRSRSKNGCWGEQVNTKQANSLKKIISGFSRDDVYTELLNVRQVELIEAVNSSDMDESFERALMRSGIRRGLIQAARDGEEYQSAMDKFKEEVSLIMARFELADQIDSARTAA